LEPQLTGRPFQVVASLGSIYPKDTEAPPSGVDDMTKLAYLHEPGVLHNLSCRYGLNEIYVSNLILPSGMAILSFVLPPYQYKHHSRFSRSQIFRHVLGMEVVCILGFVLVPNCSRLPFRYS
jgi:hypothetical protein